MYGISSNELKWFSSYLSGRKQVVKFRQETSELLWNYMWRSTGVGSRPNFVLIISNDISNFAVEGCVQNMYADEVIIHTSATSKDELEHRL